MAAAPDADADLLQSLGVTARGTAEVERDVIARAFAAAEPDAGGAGGGDAAGGDAALPPHHAEVVRPAHARATRLALLRCR
jgi:hypothetical protein